MAKTRITGRRAASKRNAPTAVQKYLSRVPKPARGLLRQMREAIRSVVPREATETISYRMPAFKHDGVLVWYAAFANHVSLFPGGAVLEAFTDELTGFKTSTGTVQFPLDKPLPIGGRSSWYWAVTCVSSTSPPQSGQVQGTGTSKVSETMVTGGIGRRP